MWMFGVSYSSSARLVGKTVLITGANSGIGKETARDLYRRGARVIMACRDVEKAKAVVEDLKNNPPSRTAVEYAGDPGELVVYPLNLASFASVRELARNVLSTEPSLHILVNNAGIMGVPFEKSEDGNEMHLQVNHLSHMLLTLLLLPKIQASTPGCRIVNVSSKLHLVANIDFDDIQLEKSYGPIKAYSRSKLANILFTSELVRRMEDAGISGINVYSLHPGVVHTDLTRSFDKGFFPGFKSITRFFSKAFVKSAEQGAQTTIHCAVSEAAAKETGLYYSECKVTQPWRVANDVQVAADFWELSCKILGLNPQLNLNDLVKEAAKETITKL